MSMALPFYLTGIAFRNGVLWGVGGDSWEGLFSEHGNRRDYGFEISDFKRSWIGGSMPSDV